MDIKQIRYFIAIVENHFNLSQAAELLYVSQPTLSMMINDFEKEKMLNYLNAKGDVLLVLLIWVRTTIMMLSVF